MRKMPGGTREVAESCVDSLNMELVATYCKRLHPTKPDLAGRRIEAIGYQVGLQLAERYFICSLPFSYFETDSWFTRVCLRVQ